MKKHDILKFWRDIEIFNLPDLNKKAHLIDGTATLPWLHKLKEPKKNYKWQFTLLFGKVAKKNIISHLNTLIKEVRQNDWEEPASGFSCLSALILDADGRPGSGDYVAASYIFGIQALAKKSNLSVVSQDIAQAKLDYLERYNIPEDINIEEDKIYPETKPEHKLQNKAKHTSGIKKKNNKGDVVDYRQLIKEIDYLHKLTPWFNQEIQVFLLPEEVPKNSEPNSSFMNSFYLDDLNFLSAIKEHQLSKTLQQFLQLSPQTNSRKDVLKNKAELFAAVHPNKMTAGRWPSSINYGLYAAQVGAVNDIFSNLGYHEGIQGVNGPPGTGKTTLLLDVIAEIVVKRAKIISKIGSNGIFQRGYTKIEKETKYDQYTYALHPALQKDFGIVVASSNNEAVENISKELPLKIKIDLDNFPEADYFSECCTKLTEKESWGALAAPLGNSKNRTRFRESFWNTKPENKTGIYFHDVLHEVYKNKDAGKDMTQDYIHRFDLQNKKFKSLLAEFEEFKKSASEYHELLPAFIQSQEELRKLDEQLENIKAQILDLNAGNELLQSQQANMNQEAERIQAFLNLHMQRKPSLFYFQKLFKTKTFKKWNTEADQFMDTLKGLLTQLDNINLQLKDNQEKSSRFTQQQKQGKAAQDRLESFFFAYQKLENEFIRQYEMDRVNSINQDFYNKEVASIHLLNPYHSPKIAKLRSEIFLTALQLHHDAILANAKQIRNNLNLYFEMIAGWANVSAKISQSLWDTLFLCVPVVSTTLASVSRLFPKRDQHQIGWLLLDEAGQATPQSAAGLLYRAKRAVIVGDPLQVEPVVTIPEKLVAKLRKEHNVTTEWSPLNTSVQELADRITLMGTYMDVDYAEQPIWTGFPLRTHRRCDEPMFSIANKIAYSNQMVKAIRKNSTDAFIGHSTWFNVGAEGATIIKDHVIQEEIDLLEQKISQLRTKGYEGKIYIISPFKSIASHCENTFRADKKISCGTIHKFQGKEADIVFLILGSNPKSAGARNWASQKPNMLNVALTRAKKRIYVIGNKNLWASCNYFNHMANELRES